MNDLSVVEKPKPRIKPTAPKEPVTKAKVSLPNVVILKLDDITVSTFEPQVKRRAKFTDEEILSLGASIESKGLIQPITVRPVSIPGEAAPYQIVCGERRSLAMRRIGNDEISAIIRELSDEDAAEIQLQENLNRKDPDPLDEAYSYKYLIDTKGMTTGDIAIHFGRTENMIIQRLKLNDAISELQEDIALGFLPLSQAVEIAKYPENLQKRIRKDIVYVNDNREDGVLSLTLLKKEIARTLLKELPLAPFDITDDKLCKGRPDCPSCPEQTGFNRTLFEDISNDGAKEPARCLNTGCWENKVNASITKTHKQLTEAGRQETGNSSYIAPKLSNSYWVSSDSDLLSEQRYHVISSEKDKCEKAVQGLMMEGREKGTVKLVCLKTGCKKHSPRASSSGSSNSSPQAAEKAREERLERKEEIFDTYVAVPVRLKVLQQCSKKFDANNTIFTLPEAPAMIVRMIARHWKLQCQSDNTIANEIRQALSLSETKLPTQSYQVKDRHIEALSEDDRSRLLFLLIYSFEDRMFQGDKYRSQGIVKTLAGRFDVNYALLDAEQRLQIVEEKHKKHRDKFEKYVQDVTNGKSKTKIPRIHSEKWTPKD